ncbi:hypothetical protein CANCADRAFT_226 [Tortispora caseinolytica NRRL Y-17796]|uniref:Bud22 domain-containing protein n=1 Tax=Tortispora caseinolytica NRRL Y-17796 TaxID=767744 RepID=A0A1E4TIS5_9ASCO|nr:hypothetical protein CANCADRAFT_226 [Tortispora caseinolytica NRRL Y-17796]
MSKRNIIWELDLLEASLGRDTRLARSKFAAKKHEKREDDGKEIDREAVEAEIITLKKEYMLQKVYYGCKQIARAMKKVRPIEIQRLKKRMKQHKKQTEKVARYEEEMAVLKKLDYDVYSACHLSKHIKNDEELVKYSEQFICDNDPTELYKGSSVAERNVAARLYGHSSVSDAVKEALNTLKRSYFYIENGDRSAKKDIRDEDVQNRQHTEKEEQKTEGVDDTDKMVVIIPDDDVSVDTSEVEEFFSADEDYNDDTDSEQLTTEPATISNTNPTDSQEASLHDTDSDNEEIEESSNLPELATGYYSGSDASDIEMEEAPEEPKKKNRMGQRARRELWEKKYGKNANHLKNQKEHNQKGSNGSRPTKDFRSHRDSKIHKETKPRKDFKKEFKKETTKPADLESLHPSWAARKKEIEVFSIKPKGKKVKFD